MIEHPKAEELVEAVARWIDGVRPQLAPRDAFLARVAANALRSMRAPACADKSSGNSASGLNLDARTAKNP